MGTGPVSMRERVRLIGGKNKVSSALGLGTELEAVVPLSISFEDVSLGGGLEAP